ncbi:MAG: ParA family protein [Caldilineaceae bacterium]|nr:ParA family protein [Caldilineaceae bacterium]
MPASGAVYLSMVLSIASQKGGVGKTTTSISLAAGLAHRGKRVLLIDIDSQANSSKVLVDNFQQLRAEQTIYTTIIDRRPLAVRSSNITNLDIIPSHILLSNTDVKLTTALDHREARLKTQLAAIRPDYEYIIIDCPPALSWLTINAFTASDKVLITVSPGYFELDSIVQISKTIQEVREYFNPQIELAGFLYTMSDPTVNAKTSLRILRQTYTDTVLKTIIPRNTDIRDAHFHKKDIFTFAPQSKSAQAYERLLVELFHL